MEILCFIIKADIIINKHKIIMKKEIIININIFDLCLWKEFLFFLLIIEI